MKTNHSLITAASIAIISAALFASCNSDEFTDDKPKASNVVENTGSILKDTGPMDYGNLGPQSQSDCIADCDFGLKAIQASDNVSCSRGSDAACETLTMLGKSLLDYANKFVPEPLQGFTKGLMDKVVGGTDPTAAKLNEISEDIKKISNQITRMENIQKGNIFTTFYNQQMDDYIPLQSDNCNAYQRYYDCLSKGDIEGAKKELTDWHNTIANGNNCDIATIKYMKIIANKTTDPDTGFRTIADIYDYWAFNTHAWEHQGYTMREQLRLADIEVVVCGCALAKAYFEMVNHQGEQRDLEAAFKEFYDYYYTKKHIEVPRHNDVLVCQINGAHVVLNKKLVECDRKNKVATTHVGDYYRVNGEDLHNVMYTDHNLDLYECLFKSLYKSEVAAIYKYYNNGKPDSQKVTMENILKDTLGLEMNIDSSKRLHVMTLRDGGCYANGDDVGWSDFGISSLYYGTVSVLNTSEYLLNNWRLGIMKFSPTKGTSDNRSIIGWHVYKSDQTQFFRTDVAWRYWNWEPDVEANKVTKF